MFALLCAPKISSALQLTGKHYHKTTPGIPGCRHLRQKFLFAVRRLAICQVVDPATAGGAACADRAVHDRPRVRSPASTRLCFCNVRDHNQTGYDHEYSRGREQKRRCYRFHVTPQSAKVSCELVAFARYQPQLCVGNPEEEVFHRAKKGHPRFQKGPAGMERGASTHTPGTGRNRPLTNSKPATQHTLEFIARAR
jgi:hypothetical protein